MSWSGYIPGDLVRELWEKEVAEDMVKFRIWDGPNGTPTISESPEQSQPVVNACDDRLGPSSYEVDQLLEQATMALRQAVEIAWKVHARGVFQRLSQDRVMTLGLDPVSPFTQRLTLYSGLIGTLCRELSSIAPIRPAADATGSLKPQELESSSPRKAEPFSPSSSFDGLYVNLYDEEPPRGSVVLDHSHDAWQRRDDGLWSCAVDGNTGSYSDWDWRKLTTTYRLRLIYRGTEDD